jgi:hypothetical protein
MNKVRFHWSYPININIDTDKNVDVYIDCFDDSPMPTNAIRIIILQEPFLNNRSVQSFNNLYEFINNKPDRYTHLFTYYDEILKTHPKSTFFLATTSWMQGYIPRHKKFSVSALVGGKNNPVFSGYAIRHNLWRAKDKIIIPKDFYLSTECRWSEGDYNNNKTIQGSIVKFSKAPLFDSQFHLAIESTYLTNVFSEKLIDCFQTKTVPIHYGCPNIKDFFNIDGIFVAQSVNEIINICNNLTPDTYNSMMPAIEDNYNKSHKYCIYDEQIKDIIVKIINE